MLSIKKVESTDIDTLVSLCKRTFFDTFLHLNDAADMETYASSALSAEQLLAEIRHPNSAFYFAVLNDERVGYIKLNTGIAQNEVMNENSLEIERIYVLSEHQGKRIGKHLMDLALATAKNKNLRYIWLGVWENNHKAILFYEQHGFKIFGSHPFLLGNDMQTDLLMRMAIT